jgi:hypothetical protein
MYQQIKSMQAYGYVFVVRQLRKVECLSIICNLAYYMTCVWFCLCCKFYIRDIIFLASGYKVSFFENKGIYSSNS